MCCTLSDKKRKTATVKAVKASPVRAKPESSPEASPVKKRVLSLEQEQEERRRNRDESDLRAELSRRREERLTKVSRSRQLDQWRSHGEGPRAHFVKFRPAVLNLFQIPYPLKRVFVLEYPFPT